MEGRKKTQKHLSFNIAVQATRHNLQHREERSEIVSVSSVMSKTSVVKEATLLVVLLVPRGHSV